MSEKLVKDILERARRKGFMFVPDNGGIKLKVPRNEVVDEELINLIRGNIHLIREYLNSKRGLDQGEMGFRKIGGGRRNTGGGLPLSFSQERIWFIHKLKGSTQYI